MRIEQTPIEGLLVLYPRIFRDDRGSFIESFNEEQYKSLNLPYQFIQDNESVSKKNVLRGLHFQNPPFEQGKLVRVSNGSVIDVAVDLRKSSKTFGKYFAVELNSEQKNMLWIPPGFAHGFYTLSDNTVFSYKCTNIYHKESEQCILWNDADLNIHWGNISDPIISEKDLQGIPWKAFNSSFE